MACGKVFGRSPQDVLGKQDRDLLAAEDATALQALKIQVIESGVAARKRLHLTSVRNKLYDVFLEPLRDASGKVTGLSGVSTELDES